jgi:hypothetical protein
MEYLRLYNKSKSAVQPGHKLTDPKEEDEEEEEEMHIIYKFTRIYQVQKYI